MKFALGQSHIKGISRHEQAFRFYKEVFGFQIVHEDEKWMELSVGNCCLTIYKGDPSELVLESDTVLEAFSPFDVGSPEDSSGKWRRDPFGFAFRWRLLRESSSEKICYI